jgi:hypothetical protein
MEMQMSNPRQPQAEQKPRREVPKSKKEDEDNRSVDHSPPGELLEGEGDPGVTITGGSGHA